MKNVIVYDFPERENDVFVDGIIESTKERWEVLGLQKGDNEISFVLKLFLNRHKFEKIVFWQQRHGIIFANLCNIFRVNLNNCPKLFILTFIYKKEKGLKGLLKAVLYCGTAKSKYVTNIICYSRHEVEYYEKNLGAPQGKIVSTTFGLMDQKYRNGEPDVMDEGYLLDVGRSNRDHGFLIDALDGTKYHAIIADRTYNANGRNNCTIRHDVKYGESLYEIIEKNHVIVVPLIDENISAGQTVFIQAMMLSKPIIVTSSNTIDEYVIDGVNGFVIPKTKNALINCLDYLSTNDSLYKEICKNARKMYEEKYSFDVFGKNIGKIIANNGYTN